MSPSQLKPVLFDPFALRGELIRTAPATEGQKEIWTSLAISPEATLAYNQSLLISLSAPLNERRLERALAKVIETHDALRLSFSPMGRTLHVAKTVRTPINFIDLSTFPEATKENFVRELTRKEVETPFSLEEAPLLRLLHLRLSPTETKLFLSAHHLVCDGWSLAVILEDLVKAYEEYDISSAPSFAQYAEDEALRRENGTASAAVSYWSKLFADGGPLVELPISGLRPSQRSFSAARCDRNLCSTLSSDLRSFARKERASFAAFQWAAFAVLLARLTGERDVVIGMPNAGQAKTGQKRLVGHAVHLLPLRIQLNPNESFQSLLARVQDLFLDANEHQDFTFGELLQNIPLERDPSRIPLVPVMFNVESGWDKDKLSLEGIPLQIETLPKVSENFEIFLHIADSKEGSRWECQYNTDLFSASRIETLLIAFEKLLTSILKDPSSPWEKLSTAELTDDFFVKRRGEDKVWKGGEAQTLIDLLQESVLRHGKKIALEAEDGVFTYEQLWFESEKLAKELLSSGVERGHRIGLCLTRSSRLIISQLAILRVGAAYVPLDPSFPLDRIDLMIRDAKMHLVITEAKVKDLVLGARNSFLWETRKAADPRMSEGPKPDDAAYIIYTSGSTGRPKGVVISQKSTVNFLLSMKETLSFPESARLLSVTTLSFDISVMEIFLPLISGATLILANDMERKDGFLLAERLSKNDVTDMQATPSTWRMLGSLGWKPNQNLSIYCGGEAFPPDLRLDLKGAKALWNLYGPTEATVWITAKKLLDDDAITVGKALANNRLFVLDEEGQLLPPGIKGEVYIAGENLAIGYWQRPELDLEKFVPSIEGHGRMYRTGDVGRFTERGELEILGRMDAQIKLRGYRIELGEIEHQILEMPGVRSATVLVSEGTGDKASAEIVAYLTWSDVSQLEALKERLRLKLPDYMVPKFFIELKALPLLPNGKINRKALPRPTTHEKDRLSLETRSDTSSFEGPKLKLAKLWETALGRPGLRNDDDFFLLGGHSLLAIQLLVKINQEFKSSLTLRDIFQHPKFGAFSSHVLKGEVRERSDIPKAAVKMLSLGQERQWYAEELSPGPIHTIPYAWTLKGRFDPEAFSRVIKAMGEEHDVLTMGVRLEQGAPKWAEVEGLTLECPLIDLTHMADAEAIALSAMTKEAGEVIDLTRPPLIRFKIYRIAADHHILSITVHHMIWDGWSFDLFFAEAEKLYKEALTRPLTRRPQRSPSYADFSLWQRQRAEDARGSESERYWRSIYSSIPEPLDLPLDRPRPAQFEGAASSHLMNWSAEERVAFESEAKKEGMTPFVLAMAAFVLTLHRLSGQTDIVVGTPLRGRTREEFERIFGLFINVMPLRFQVNPEMSFHAFLEEVRKVCMESYAHEDYPFESLLSKLEMNRDESRTPLYSAIFTYQDTSHRVRELEGARVESLFLPTHGVPTDLVFWMKKGQDEISSGFDYRKKLWDPDSIASFAEIYSHVLKECLSLGHAPIKTLKILPPQQIDTIRVLSHGPEITLEKDTLSGALYDVFKEHPHSLFRAGGQSYTYEAMLERASRVAKTLEARGLGPGDRIGLCTDRSIALLEGMFGIVLAGAAYVPFDPALPKERLKVMADQAEIKAIVTQEDWLDILPLDSRQCLVIGELKDQGLVTRPKAKKSDPAYVIFTSGSTGIPKAVQINQGAAIHLMESMQTKMELSKATIAVALSTITFDISVYEIFGTVLNAGTLILAESAYAVDGEALAELLDRESVNYLQATPTGWRILIEAGWKGRRQMRGIAGGEALPRDLVTKVLPLVKDFWNGYGPTEATVWSTVDRIENDQDAITIGKPLPGYETFVMLDGQLAPIGAWGELHIGGPSLADGYLKDEEKTKNRFVASSLSPGGRLYVTGDIVRLRSDGRYDFKSRADTQVKVRGFRIELEEIETVALKHKAVKGAAVKVWEPRPGDQRIVLYITSQTPLSLSDLLPFFRSALPKYMWPAHMETLRDFPRTTSGKLDRKALPKPDFRQARVQEREASPRNPTKASEIAVAEVWRELLGVEHVSIDDNFFDLGGHSLLTLKMLARINEKFGKSLKLRDVLTGSLAQIAERIEAKDADVKNPSQPKAGDRG